MFIEIPKIPRLCSKFGQDVEVKCKIKVDLELNFNFLYSISLQKRYRVEGFSEGGD